MINGALRVARRAGATIQAGGETLDPEEFRTSLDRLRKLDQPGPPRGSRRGRTHTTEQVAGAPLHILTPTSGRQSKVLLYLHGGGYVFGPAMSHWAATKEITRNGEADLAMLVYPKVPEASHDAIVESAVAAYQLLLDRYPADGIVVAGDSAGGGLALTLLSVLRERDMAQPHAAVLISPWLDLMVSNPAAAAQSETDLLLSIESVRLIAPVIAGDRATDDPVVSPGFTSTSGLAPLHIFVGTHEIFLADCREFAAKAEANGDPVTLREMHGGQHVAALFPTPEGKIARAQMLALIDWP